MREKDIKIIEREKERLRTVGVADGRRTELKNVSCFLVHNLETLLAE